MAMINPVLEHSHSSFAQTPNTRAEPNPNMLLTDGPEYVQRTQKPFQPPTVTIAQIHAAIPKELLQQSTHISLLYVTRDIVLAAALYKLATMIDGFSAQFGGRFGVLLPLMLKWLLWFGYWNIQGIVMAGWWTLGHEASHEALSPIKWVNHAIGFGAHTFLLVPYFSLRSSHRLHHKAVNCLEREHIFVPRTRSSLKLPPKPAAHVANYHDVFEETPIYTLLNLFLMQLFGWQMYLFMNAMGRPGLPPWTNHFNPSSAFFKPKDRKGVICSNIGVSAMALLLWYFAKKVGLSGFLKFYFVPYSISNHWVVMLTYLHHSDPTTPYYRGKEWNFVRGALATVDRDLLGWAGRFFFHNTSHNHIAHHLFATAPFYNLPAITLHLQSVLGEDYNFDSTNCFRALYRTFTQCQFIEDEGDVVFYKDGRGRAARYLKGETCQ